MIKFYFSAVYILFFSANIHSQKINDTINKVQVEKIITYLASDRLKGRVNYTKEQLEVAEYISKEFTNYGLNPFPGFSNFYQPFRTASGNRSEVEELKWNGRKLEDSLFYFIPHSLSIHQGDLSDFFILQAFPPLADSILFYNWKRDDNVLIWVVLPENMSFSEATKNLHLPVGVPNSDILMVAANDEPETLKLSPDKKFPDSVLYNVVGIIPGRSLPEEAIIFSAHYDHVDKGQFGETGEIYNGANDDASGTTAVLQLARYFAMRRDNERTLIFCLFAGEELGLYGSRSFVNFIKPENIKAVINIEMIGRTNATGKNAFFVTGSYYSDLIKILARNLLGEKIKVMAQKNDPKFLFQRSDNYPFARKGIPAHSIMCSDDNEPCYHKPCDDVKRIDIENMTRIIKAIAKACTSVISGKDTPTRIKNN